jgi:hypothetical protein
MKTAGSRLNSNLIENVADKGCMMNRWVRKKSVFGYSGKNGVTLAARVGLAKGVRNATDMERWSAYVNCRAGADNQRDDAGRF